MLPDYGGGWGVMAASGCMVQCVHQCAHTMYASVQDPRSYLLQKFLKAKAKSAAPTDAVSGDQWD